MSHIFFVRLHCLLSPSLPISPSIPIPLPLPLCLPLPTSIPSPWYPLYKLLATSKTYSSRSLAIVFLFFFWIFLEVVLCIKPFFFLLYIVHFFFLARVCCWCIRVSLFFNANNIFFEQIFFFCFWVTLSRFCVLFKLKAQKKWKKNFLKSKADSFPKEKVRDLLILIPLSIQSSIFHSSMSFHLPYTFHQASS